MPHIRLRSVSEGTAAKVSHCAADLAELIQSSPDNFTFELIPSTFFEAGQKISGEPFVEVQWFSRPQELKEKVVSVLEAAIRASEQVQFVTVVFLDLRPESYFENGQHF